MPTISILLPTCGRDTLSRAIQSVVPQLESGDELIVIGDGPQPTARSDVAAINDNRLVYSECGPTHFFGNAQRNLGMSRATGEYLAFLDDDDEFSTDALSAIRRAAAESPGRPFMFRLKCRRPKFTIWRTQRLKVGNISGGAFVVPNCAERLATWPNPDEVQDGCSDVTFIRKTLALYPDDALVWRPEVIYHVHQRSYNAR